MNTPPKPASRRPLRTFAIVAAIALATLALLYTLGGFLLLPWYAQRELPRLLEQQLQRPAQVGAISFNPFTLRFEISDFALHEKDGRPLVGFKHALVDLEWRSLAQRAVVFGEIRLDAPALNIEISPEGHLNLAALAGDQSTPAAQPAKPPAIPRVVIGDVQIARGAIAFEDQRVGYKNRFEELTVKLSSLSTLANDEGDYALSARTPGGATLKWKGEASISPLAANGTIALEHGALPELQPFIKEFLNASITDGRTSIELPYRFALPDGKPKLEISGGKLTIEAFALTASGANAPFFRFNTLAVDDLALDLVARTVSIGALRVDAPDLKMQRDETGALDLAKLLLPRKADAPSAPWQIGIAAIELNKGAYSLLDNSIGITFGLKDLALKLRDVTGDFSKPVAFEVAGANVNGGTLSARGRVAPDGVVDAQIAVAALGLTPLQPLLARYTNATLASGEAALSGTLKTDRKTTALVYTGGASLSNVQLKDPTGVPLIGWKSLATTTLQAQVPSPFAFKSLATTTLREQLVPTRLRIDTLHWQEPGFKIAIAADRTTNLRRAFTRGDDAAPAAAETATPAAPAPAATIEPQTSAEPEPSPAADGDEAGTLQIRRIEIKQGTLDFSDDALGGGFATAIRELNGTLNGISSDRSTRSQLVLEGRVDEYGYARLSGSLNPFLPRDRSNLRLDFRNLDITKVTPYAVRFAGRKIATGKLSLDLNYSVRNNQLQGDNKIVLEDFTLGEKVDSPGATNLPLDLAIALLKDSDGRIDVSVPVTGNLNDPKFNYGEIIHKAIVNLIVGIVTAPFRLLGRLFGGGGGDEVSQIAFEPGSARLLPPEREKIGRVVQMLGKRPELKLLVPARYDSDLDARALKRAALRRELGKRGGLDLAEEDPPGPLNIEDRRIRAAVRELFAERYGNTELDKLRAEAEAKEKSRPADDKQKIGLMDRIGRFTSGEPQVADTGEFYRTLGARLVASQTLPADTLPELARKRAATIGDAVKSAGVDGARIALTTADPLSKPDAKSVAIELALSAK